MELQHQPYNEYSGLISFRIYRLDLLEVQRTLKKHLQHHNSKASVLWHSAFFTVQILHPYMTTGKTIDLTIWTFVSKVMSLFFNTLSRFVIDILPRSKYLLISWLQSPSAVILELKKIASIINMRITWGIVENQILGFHCQEVQLRRGWWCLEVVCTPHYPHHFSISPQIK